MAWGSGRTRVYLPQRSSFSPREQSSTSKSCQESEIHIAAPLVRRRERAVPVCAGMVILRQCIIASSAAMVNVRSALRGAIVNNDKESPTGTPAGDSDGQMQKSLAEFVPAGAKKVRSFSPAACTAEKIPLGSQTCALGTSGVQCAAASRIFFSNESPAQRVSFESACALSAGGCRQDRGQIRAGSRASAHGGAPPPPPSARGGGDGARPRSACGGAPATERSRPMPARSPAE